MKTSYFEQWLNFPVRRVQCVTYQLAQRELGMPKLGHGQGWALRPDHPITGFRMLPKHRDAAAYQLRALVRDSFRTGVFPGFWIFRNEQGWHWVSRDASRSSARGFKRRLGCVADALDTLPWTRPEPCPFCHSTAGDNDDDPPRCLNCGAA
jgi:hypothetical protein